MKKSNRRNSRHGRDKKPGRSHRQSQGTALSSQGIGRIQKNPRGFAFIIPTDRKASDAYVPPEDADYLLNGDLVKYSLVRRRGRLSAKIESIVERGRKELIGLVRQTHEGPILFTDEGESFNVVPPQKSALGKWALGQIDQYPRRGHQGTVSIVRILGDQLLPAHDLTLVMSRFNLNRHVPDNAVKEAERCYEKAEKEFSHPGERVDLTSLPFVTIDGADAKDFDDAVLVLRNHKGSPFVLFVAIADVSFFVSCNSHLDKAASKRGTSVYFPGTCIPMLPETLSNDLCSLRPQEKKLTVTCELHYDGEGRIKKSLFYESIIQTRFRLTYDQVQGFFDNSPEIKNELESIGDALKTMRHFYRILSNHRKKEGYLDFELPENEIKVNTDGEPISSQRAKRFESHRLIEEFMIAANIAVARSCRQRKLRALYRVHEAPDPKSLDEINHLLKGLGIARVVKELSSKSLGQVLEMTHGLQGAGTLHQAILRLQKQAHYEPEPRGHFGLALSDYTHFTSPIRRYPDLVVHRALKQLIVTKRKSDKEYEETRSLDTLGQSLSELERRAMEAERFMLKRKQCWFMRKHVGCRFDGVVSGVIPKGLFVEIGDFGIEGFLGIDTFDSYFEYDEVSWCFRRRPGRQKLGIGDKVKIEIIDVSIQQQEITLIPAKS